MNTEEIRTNPAPLASMRRSSDGARKQNRKRHLRRLFPIVGALLLVSLIVWGFWPKPAPVEMARATVGPIRTTVNEEGKTRIRQRFNVSATVAGHVRRIPFKPGAEVKANETVVAVIDPVAPAILDARTRALAEARRETAAANLERARAAQKLAVSELRRVEKLAEAKTVSDQDLENAQFRETSANKELAAAESTLRQAEAELAEFKEPAAGAPRAPVEIKSPVTGKVLRVFEESSRVVAPGTPLIEVGDPSDLEAAIEVLSRDGASIRAGARVELEQWGGSRPLEGKVRLVEPAAFTKISALGVEEQRVLVIVDILTPMSERGNLGDNFRVEGRIVTAEAANALKVPSGALFRQGKESAVYLLRNGRAHMQKVSTGLASATETQITSGLSAGDEVIVYPGDRVHDGDRVVPIQVSVNP